MIPLSVAAERHLDALTEYYASLGRDRAIERAAECVEAACRRYERRPGSFLPAPRPYPALASLGLRWTKEGPYWIAFAEGQHGAIVAGVFHEAADIPNRL